MPMKNSNKFNIMLVYLTAQCCIPVLILAKQILFLPKGILPSTNDVIKKSNQAAMFLKLELHLNFTIRDIFCLNTVSNRYNTILWTWI